MGADYYETEEERAQLLSEGKVPMGIGKDAVIKNCIVDKNARIGKDVQIINKEGRHIQGNGKKRISIQAFYFNYN